LERFKGIALIDASNPAAMTVVGQITYGEEIFRVADFAFTHDGTELYIAKDSGLTGARVPNLSIIYDALFPVQRSWKVATLIPADGRERIFRRVGRLPIHSARSVSVYDPPPEHSIELRPRWKKRDRRFQTRYRNLAVVGEYNQHNGECSVWPARRYPRTF
jgi:hypothetical protein